MRLALFLIILLSSTLANAQLDITFSSYGGFAGGTHITFNKDGTFGYSTSSCTRYISGEGTYRLDGNRIIVLSYTPLSAEFGDNYSKEGNNKMPEMNTRYVDYYGIEEEASKIENVFVSVNTNVLKTIKAIYINGEQVYNGDISIHEKYSEILIFAYDIKRLRKHKVVYTKMDNTLDSISLKNKYRMNTVCIYSNYKNAMDNIMSKQWIVVEDTLTDLADGYKLYKAGLGPKYNGYRNLYEAYNAYDSLNKLDLLDTISIDEMTMYEDFEGTAEDFKKLQTK